MAVDVFVTFNGNCREAVEFYASVFGCEAPNYLTFGSGPQDPNYPVPEDSKDLIMYTSLNIFGSEVMFSDTYWGDPATIGNNITLTLGTKDIDLLKTVFEKLSTGGTIGMELQETFWSKCFGACVDKFGVSWQVSHDSGEFKY